MTTRRWKLSGQLVDESASATITIGGTQVFSGSLTNNTQDALPFNFLASGTFDVDDSVDTSHEFSMTLSSGTVIVGALYWDRGYQMNESLNAEEKAYQFQLRAGTVPAEIVNSVASKGGWGQFNNDYFTMFPGSATSITDPRTQDVRANLKMNGSAVSVETNNPLLMTSGQSLTFTAGIPASPQA